MGNINERIFKIIDEHKEFSDTKMAKFIGCGKSAVSRWRKGDITPHSKYTGLIAEYLGVSTNYLVNGENLEDDELDNCIELLHKDRRYRVLLDSSSKLDKEALDQLIAFIDKINPKED